MISILNRCQAGESDAVMQLQPLLLEILGMLRRAATTPLQFGIDLHGIASTVLQGLSVPAEDRANIEMIAATLDTILRRSLENQNQHLTANVGPAVTATGVAEDIPPSVSTNHNGPPPDRSNPLSDWLERLEAAVCQTHPSAIDIVALRMEGFPDRDIATRLRMGVRLEQRIVSDINRRLNSARASLLARGKSGGRKPVERKEESPDAC